MAADAQLSGAAVANNVLRGEAAAGKLARGHYENFTVGSALLPRRLRQDLLNIYAFCRLADDFADEPGVAADPRGAINRWEQLLDQAASGSAQEPLFAALGDTIQRRNLSLDPFRNLLSAFHLDLDKSRFETWADLREYTRLSADPVGRIVLQVVGRSEAQLFALSDKICTALQLANHWQDVAADWKRGRIYLPQEDLKRFGVDEADIAIRRITDRFKDLMIFEVDRAQALFLEGRPLIGHLTGFFRWQVALYWQGGTAALRAIRRVDYDVLTKSAKLGWGAKLGVAARSALAAGKIFT